jgi:hypothetical protein
LDKGWFPNTPGSAGSIAEQRMYRMKTVKACNDDDGGWKKTPKGRRLKACNDDDWEWWIDKKKKTLTAQNDDGGGEKDIKEKTVKACNDADDDDDGGKGRHQEEFLPLL